MQTAEDKFQEIREFIEKSLDDADRCGETLGIDNDIVHDAEQRQYYCEYMHITSELIKTFDRDKSTEAADNNMSYFEEIIFNK